MDAARQEMNDIESQLVQARSALAAMNGQLASTPSSLAMPGVNGGGNPYASAQAELAGAQARGWTDSHPDVRSEEHTSELQSIMRISYAVFCLKKKQHDNINKSK